MAPLLHRAAINSSTSSTCSYNIVNFGPLTAEIGSGVWCTLQISTSFASWQRYCRPSLRLYSSGRQPNFGALNRWRHLYSAGQPSRWALAHILVYPGLSFFIAKLESYGPLMHVSAMYGNSTIAYMPAWTFQQTDSLTGTKLWPAL